MADSATGTLTDGGPLPNTWYAKVDGRQDWGIGARHVAAFALEYGLWMWPPVLAAG